MIRSEQQLHALDVLARGVLGVAENASPLEVRTAYHDLVREWHPDLKRPGADKRIREINAAYDHLKKRRAHSKKEKDRATPPAPARSSTEPSGGCRFEGATGRTLFCWGVVDRVERQGVGLYNVFLESGVRVETFGFIIKNASLARVQLEIEYVGPRMLRVGVRLESGGNGRVDVDALEIKIN